MISMDLERARAWWENTGRLYELAPPQVEFAARPWGMVPRLFTHEKLALRCGAQRGILGATCERVAGGRTGHPGVGHCNLHQGNSPRATVEGFMIMAHAFANAGARAIEISPAQALLEEVNRTAAGIAWLDEKVGTATADDDILPPIEKVSGGGRLGEYVLLRERERAHLVRAASAAITSHAAELVGEAERVKGELLARLLLGTLDKLELSPADEQRAREVLRGELLALDVASTTELPVDRQQVEG